MLFISKRFIIDSILLLVIGIIHTVSLNFESQMCDSQLGCHRINSLTNSRDYIYSVH